MRNWIAARGWRRTLVGYLVFLPIAALHTLAVAKYDMSQFQSFLSYGVLLILTLPFYLAFRFLWRQDSMPFSERGLKGDDPNDVA